ncbi:hydantoinase/carbamoylase family amidase [Pseudomonas syringae]|uniref:Zn-dependent hydrolase n=1 Tax=Pseudomonas syringae TaxID=317 RepID=UPI001F42C1CD|nr:Zn-dependent hydrolase [Pseudomonas syringae]MCF8984592.1 hydantoinase/carbamoylase family amidase [Pseudomonas syringae]MCF9004966.1 hydantoinase/carbamoylase family amidase [Pseudomonas syringae]
MNALKCNGERLWKSLMDMAEIGATDNGGNCRLALSNDDKAGRELFMAWCRKAGMSITFDAIGNLFARLPGLDEQLPPVVMGSHLDTQPKGGRFDGIYGVLSGLEVIRSLADQGMRNRRALEIAVWTNEEGARFTPAMFGSAVFTGSLALETALNARDSDGTSVRESLETIGQSGDSPFQRPFDAYFEAHIEQGPILEKNSLPVGVVTGGQAICWLDVHVQGQCAHAGTTPMALRKDALFGVAEMAAQLEALVADFNPQGLVTIGQLNIAKSSRNTIAGAVTFTVDLRHHQDAQIALMEQQVYKRFQRVADSRRLTVSIERNWLSPATPFDSECVDAVRRAVQALGYHNQDIVSGAGHDAILLARHCPTTMVFIPCVDGLSHNEAEAIYPEDARKGCDVLLNAVIERAQR